MGFTQSIQNFSIELFHPLLPPHSSIPLHSSTTHLLHLLMYRSRISGCYGTTDQVILAIMYLEVHYFLLFLFLMFVIKLFLIQTVIVSIASVVKCINYLSINLILLLLSPLNLFTVMYGDQHLLLPSMTLDITQCLLMITLNFLGCMSYPKPQRV